METNNESHTNEGIKLVGHLLRLTLTDGETILLDPGEIKNLSPHRSEDGTTVLCQRNDDYKYFVDAPYDTVEYWVTKSLEYERE